MTLIVVFARLPVPGKAKTRLAASVGPEAAATFTNSVQPLSSVKQQGAHQLMQWFTAPQQMTYQACRNGFSGMARRCRWPAQLPAADLGQRLLSALTAAATVQRGPAAACEQQDQDQDQQQQQHQAALVIGTDIPDLSSNILAAAVAALSRGPFDVVLGPAHDGGFYLLGLSRLALLRPEVQAGGLFAGVEWSSGTVLQRTLAAAQQLGLCVAPLQTLPELRDIDTLQDLQDWWQQRQQQQKREEQQHQQQEQWQQQQQQQQQEEVEEQQQEPGQRCQAEQKGCAGVASHVEDQPGQQFQQLCNFVSELCSSSNRLPVKPVTTTTIQ